MGEGRVGAGRGVTHHAVDLDVDAEVLPDGAQLDEVREVDGARRRVGRRHHLREDDVRVVSEEHHQVVVICRQTRTDVR